MIFIVLVKSWTPGEVTFSKVYWSNLQRFSLLCGLVPSTLRWHRMTWSGWKKFPVVQFFGSADQSHFVNAGLKTITLRSELRTRFANMLRLHNLNFYIKKKIIVCIYKDSTVNRLTLSLQSPSFICFCTCCFQHCGFCGRNPTSCTTGVQNHKKEERGC